MHCNSNTFMSTRWVVDALQGVYIPCVDAKRSAVGPAPGVVT